MEPASRGPPCVQPVNPPHLLLGCSLSSGKEKGVPASKHPSLQQLRRGERNLEDRTSWNSTGSSLRGKDNKLVLGG